MSNMIRPALSLLVLMTLITGVAYPLVVTGVAQVAFPDQANGSLVRDDSGKVRGSSLIAQDFTGDNWFHPRPRLALLRRSPAVPVTLAQATRRWRRVSSMTRVNSWCRARGRCLWYR